MCSRVRGPATVPPFVTWPTRNTAVPVSFANRWSRAAHSRTWLTLPGAPSISSVYMVWIESTTSTAGSSSAARASICPSSVSPRKTTSPAPPPSRSARIRTCAADSSPETYSVACPPASSRAATCSRSVLLPIPGSPPEQDERARHHATPEDEIELPHPRGPPLGRVPVDAAESRRTSRPGGSRHRAPAAHPPRFHLLLRLELLHQRVPLPARRALPLPACGFVPALRTEKRDFGLGHVNDG